MSLYYQMYGPYVNREGRKIVIVRRFDGSKKTTTYARYLIEHALGRELLPSETVDHIDNNKLNDNINNLQLLSRADNIIKSIPPSEVWLECKYCKKKFKRRLKVYWRNKYERQMDGPFCSKSCVGKVHH